MATLLEHARRTVRGLSYLTSGPGAKDVSFLGLFSDLLADAARSAFVNSLPGHPEQALDALTAQAGRLGFARFRDETHDSFAERIRTHPTRARQRGSVPMVLRAIEEYGLGTWPVEWEPDTTILTEDSWARFTVTIDHTTWSEDFWLDGVYDSDLAGLAQEIRKWVPKRSKGTLVFRTDSYEI